MASKGPFIEVPFATGDFDPEPAREAVRGRITLVVACTFFLVIELLSVRVCRCYIPNSGHRSKKAMQAILPAVTSVLGTALGFYFGSQKR